MFRNYVTLIIVALACALILADHVEALAINVPSINVTNGAYFNWGTAGFSGYGIRDNAGTIEFKNLGGSWASLNTIISNFCAGGGCSGGSATAWTSITGKPYPVNSQTWNWSGQGGQPSWLWGSNDGTNMYIWSPSNFSVSYANSAGAVPWSGVSGKTGAYSGSSFTYCGQYMSFSGGLAVGSYGSNNCGGPDVAEHYDTDGAAPVERGMIVALSNTTTTHQLAIGNPAAGESTTTPYFMTAAQIHAASVTDRERIIGAVPTKPFVIDEPGQSPQADSDGRQLVALAGRIPIHMTLDGGPIAIGDPITVSISKAGFGMKATTSGRIVGYALAPYAAVNDGEGGGDMIEVFIHLEEFHATARAVDGLILIDQVDGTEHCVVLKSGHLETTAQACH